MARKEFERENGSDGGSGDHHPMIMMMIMGMYLWHGRWVGWARGAKFGQNYFCRSVNNEKLCGGGRPDGLDKMDKQ